MTDATEPKAPAGAGLFVDETILGWRVKVSAQFRESQPGATQEALALLTKELAAIAESLPPRRIAQLQGAVFWVDERVPEGEISAKVPVFHPAREWLVQHGLDPAMAGGIEVPNAKVFLESYSWEPWAIMHELAHFYHFNVLGNDNLVIRRAYEHARAAHLYQSVTRYDGTKQRAYALENEHEYFAELTEAYFGRNDYFPFIREELKAYDPEGYAMVETLWQLP